MLGRHLTQSEVDALPDGTEVIITWSGGNGPHRYVTKTRGGVVWAYTPSDSLCGYFEVAPIDHVGAERPFTVVTV